MAEATAEAQPKGQEAASEKDNKLKRNFTILALFLFALPSMLLQLWTGIYQIFDTSIATQFNSTATLSAINIIYPAQAVVEAIAFLVSGGSTALIGKMMGEHREREANQMFSFMLVFSVIVTVVWAFGVSALGDQVWLLLGADKRLAPVCAQYWNVHRFFMPLYCTQLGFQMWLLVAGKPTYCMVVTIAGGLVTLAADVLFQGVFHLGTAGAALGFGTGTTFGAILSIVAVISKKNSLHYDIPRTSGSDFGECIKLGLADFIFSFAAGIMTAVYNIQAMKYYGETGVAVAAIFLYAQFLFLAPSLGFGKGAAPVISYKVGEGNPKTIEDIYEKYKKCSIAVIVIVAILAIVMAPVVLGLYAKPGQPVYELGAEKWVMFASCFLFVGINMVVQDMLTAFNDTVMPMVISALRSLILPIGMLIVLPLVFGGNGVWLALTFAEAITAVVSIVFLIRGSKKYHYGRYANLDAAPAAPVGAPVASDEAK